MAKVLAGTVALVLEADITDETQATEAVTRTVGELGRLDTLVNNAGAMLLGPRQLYRHQAAARGRQ
jgi:NADP-dependent 3-hydroxy acid dehydrogenase YdfG